MDILGDVRMLQSLWATYLKQEHKRADPPMAGPANLGTSSTLPGSYTPVSGIEGKGAVYPTQSVQPDPAGILAIIQDVRTSIREGLYNDLFKMMALTAGGSKATATEIAERHEEKLLQLGPVLERLHAEAFVPLIDLTFDSMVEQDMIPPWPEEIANMPLKVDFISLLAQAQKMVATSAVDQFCYFINGNYAVMPEFGDILDIDQAGNEYAEFLGLSAKIIRTQEARDARRKARNEQEQMAQGAALAEQGSKAIGNLGGTPLGTDKTALEAVLQGIA